MHICLTQSSLAVLGFADDVFDRVNDIKSFTATIGGYHCHAQGSYLGEQVHHNLLQNPPLQRIVGLKSCATLDIWVALWSDWAQWQHKYCD